MSCSRTQFNTVPPVRLDIKSSTLHSSFLESGLFSDQTVLKIAKLVYSDVLQSASQVKRYSWGKSFIFFMRNMPVR